MNGSRLVAISAALLLIIALSPPVALASSEKPQQATVTPLAGTFNQVSVGDHRAEKSPNDFCTVKWQGPATFFVNGWFTGGELYATYQDPVETGCPAPYPFGVTQIVWYVWAVLPETLYVRPEVYARGGTPSCWIPGTAICSGPEYMVELPSAGGWILTLPLGDTCCVYEPYFAGVRVDSSYATGRIEVVVDDGSPRQCANYNYYSAAWHDLVVEVGFTWDLELWSEGYNSSQNLCEPCLMIPPGPDLWTTPGGGSTSIRYFNDTPIPADFFGPGSDPFTGTICFAGVPLSTTPPGALGPTDVIVERLSAASVPTIGSSDVVPIEIIALSLVSCSPITVTYVSNPPEIWEVLACLSAATPQQIGSMTITKHCPEGGSFTASLPVTPQLIFRRIDPPPINPPIVMDPANTDMMVTQNGRWASSVPPPFGLWESPGGVTVDDDCNSLTPESLVPPRSGCFYPGMTVEPCSPQNPGPAICGGKVLTEEEALLAAHGVLPPQRIEVQEGATCLPDGRCIITTPQCAAMLEGQYQGDFTHCYPDPCAPDTTKDCFESIGQATVTLNPQDQDCQNGITLDLTSILDNSTVVVLGAGPYSNGDTIPTEIVQLELRGFDPSVGQVLVKERADMQSLGKITNVMVDGGGNLTYGESFFDVFVEIILLDMGGQTFNTDGAPLHLEATISELPPKRADYWPPPSQPPLRLFEALPPFNHIGWLCHGLHRPTVPVPCDQPTPTGACCRPAGDCVTLTQAECESVGGWYQGDGSSCSPNPCPAPADSDCVTSIGTGSVGVNPTPTPLCDVNLSLSSLLDKATIKRDPGPYSDGQTIQTEIVEMTLTAITPLPVGTVIIKERTDKASLGKIENVLTDGGGNLTYGESFFDVFVELEFPDMGGVRWNTRDIPFHLEATIDQLPPDSPYIPLPNSAPLRLFNVISGAHEGWLCHAEHRPEQSVPCQPTSCCQCRGNADGIIGPAGCIDVSDLTYLVAYLFSGGQAPPCIEEGNVDGVTGPAGPIDVSDLTYLVAFLFSGGQPPPPCI
ncbi:MAG TPA: hypothetical protein VN285_09740 [Candidatus Deferrimicrobium sp.]|nr:hypothetical protein [Candidatus Deferrimicrobium sp.]